MTKLMRKILLMAVVPLALLSVAAIKFYTDYPNSVPIGSDFFSLQRNQSYINASVSQVKQDWFNNPVFTGSGGIQGNWRVDSFMSVGGYLALSGVYYGDGTGLSNLLTSATNTYINNFTNNTFTTTNVAFINYETNNIFVNTNITILGNTNYFNTVFETNVTFTISKGGSLNVTTNVTQYLTNNILINTNVAFFTTNIANTTINTNVTYQNNTYITNLTIVTPGGITNLNGTPKTLAWWDVNDSLASIPNAIGWLTNNSGDIGWSSSVAFDSLDVTDAYLTNTFLFSTNVPFLGTDANGQLKTNYNAVTLTNFSYALPTNNVGGGAFVFGGPGTAATLYDTNITAATTLKLFDITACGATAGGIKLYVTCSGGTDRILTFPAGCSGAGYGTPPAITITNAKGAWFDIIYKPGATPRTNVFWSPEF